jgi:hypothetical protein
MELRKFIKTTIRKYLNENVEDNSDILYHGTDYKFNVFNDNKPIFFVDNIDVARTYGNFIIKAKLNMDNPIELDFEGSSTYHFFDKWYLPSDLANTIKNDIYTFLKMFPFDKMVLIYLE